MCDLKNKIMILFFYQSGIWHSAPSPPPGPWHQLTKSPPAPRPCCPWGGVTGESMVGARGVGGGEGRDQLQHRVLELHCVLGRRRTLTRRVILGRWEYWGLQPCDVCDLCQFWELCDLNAYGCGLGVGVCKHEPPVKTKYRYGSWFEPHG